MLQALKRDKAFYGYLLRLTGPIALQNLITFSLGLIDTLMVSQLGNNEMAAVTAANVPVFLLISIVFGVQSGVGILISQYWGKKDLTSISRAIGVAAGLGVALALVIALALFLWPVQIMDLMSNKHHLSLLGAPYLRVIGFSYVFNMLSSIYVSAQRSVENSSFGMKLFGVSTLLNTGMNYLLIFGKLGLPALGVRGAAIATVASQVVSAVLCIIKLTRSDGPYRLEIKRIGFDLPLLKKITSQGVPSGVQNSIIAIANVVVQSNINPFGSDAMAGCGSYSKVEGFVFLPITAFAMALTTFIGQNLGAGQFDRAKQGARIGILCSMAMAELIGVALFFLAPYAMRLFNDDPAVVAIGVLLTYAGSIGTLSVAAVLMYQAAWSALSLAVCALKQH